MAPRVKMMCGITGTINCNDNGKTAFLMAKKISHRGPDTKPSVVCTDDKAFAAVRLSIVDLQNGDQPMTDSTGNVVSQNGEIYNYKELKSDLQTKGYRFKTNCDTEVLLAGFTFYGPRFITKLDGIFAISFYHKAAKKLYLFRDYFGVKPLYYYQKAGKFEYSSEIKSFWRDSRNFDIDLDYLIYNHVFNWSSPARTMYKGIAAVVPGTYLEIDQNLQISEKKYTPDVRMHPAKDFDDAVQQTRDNLTLAVQSQIPEEVNWGVLLSGGVDSSILAWLAKQENPQLKTFSICSEETDSEDIKNAREVADFLKTEHTEIRVDLTTSINSYGDYLYSVEDINSRFYFYYLISRHLRGKVKVALCGEGADELYMGYPVYRDLDTFIGEAKLRWSEVKKYAGTISNEIVDNLNNLSALRNENLYQLMLKDQLPWFQLNPVDKCSMRFGVELRVPYLSNLHALSVAEYKSADKLSGTIEKNILRTAFKDSLLPTISRSKYFAGTRTLPYFYEKLDKLASAEYSRLKKVYPEAASILNTKDLYALSLIDNAMKENGRSETIKYVPTERSRHSYARVN